MTIRKRLMLSYFAMLAVPLILIFTMGGVIIFLFGLSDGGDDFRDAGRSAPMMGKGRLSGSQVLYLSRVIAENPLFFKDPETMAALERNLSWLGKLAVVQDGAIVYLSPGAGLKSARAVLGGKAPTAVGPRGMVREHGFQLAYSWEFSVPGESPATLHFFRDYRQYFKSFFTPGFVISLLAMAILILTDGALTYLMSRSIARPLARLENMALRIRDGDLSGGGDERGGAPEREPRKPDEFDAAFRAFGEMRFRLKDSLERQAAQEDNRRELIAAISHDLRTPLSAIKGYAEGLRDGVAATPEKRKAYLDTLLAKTRDLDRLIEDLFLFSRLELKDFPYEMRATGFGIYIADCVAELAPDFPSMRIVLDGPPADCEVRIDPLRMRRVIANIVQNAAAYSGGSGRAPRLEISSRVEGPSVLLRFCDNGPGLGEGQFELVFERFRRLDPSRGRGGAGLGLSIARLIVEAHGGKVWAEPAPGGGACFAISLPRVRKP